MPLHVELVHAMALNLVRNRREPIAMKDANPRTQHDAKNKLPRTQADQPRLALPMEEHCLKTNTNTNNRKLCNMCVDCLAFLTLRCVACLTRLSMEQMRLDVFGLGAPRECK